MADIINDLSSNYLVNLSVCRLKDMPCKLIKQSFYYTDL